MQHNQEKNGQANERLLKASKELFSYVSNYDTAKKEDSIANCKKKAEKLTNVSALEAIFPKDADEGVSTVTAVSQIEGNGGAPEVYLLSSDSKEVQALVIVKYGVSIAGSEKIIGTNMYRVKFDQPTKKFVSIENLGEVNLP